MIGMMKDMTEVRTRHHRGVTLKKAIVAVIPTMIVMTITMDMVGTLQFGDLPRPRALRIVQSFHSLVLQLKYDGRQIIMRMTVSRTLQQIEPKSPI